MTFEIQETSVQGAQPVELYEIRLSASEVYYFTTSNRPEIVSGLNTYLPAVVDRSQPQVNTDQPGSEIELTFVTTDPVVVDFTTQWATAAPEVGVSSVRISKLHITDVSEQAQPFWFGTISSIKYSNDGEETTVLCRALSDLFTLQGPRKNWGVQCNHQLYDDECTLNRLTFTQTAVVQSIAANGVEFTLDALAEPTVRYNAGEFKKFNAADSRLIVARAGPVITVQYPIPSIRVGDTVEVIEGCEHNLTDCAAFSNDINYGGSPYTPPINPFTKGLDAI